MNNTNSRRKSSLERRTANLAYWQAELKKETDEERKPGIKTKIDTCKKEIETLKARIT